jgi:hypothetical protein
MRDALSIGDYVCRELTRVLDANEPEFNTILDLAGNRIRSGPKRPSESRSAILVRCTAVVAARIRAEAKRHTLPLNAFVLLVLKKSWSE